MKRDKNREEALARHSHLYKMFCPDDDLRFICFYCGLPAEAVDHQPPISRVSDYQSLYLTYEQFLKVPCCPECNSLAGNELTASLLERSEFIKDKINDKYAHLFKGPIWTDRIIADAELSGRLKRYVKASSAQQKQVVDRLNYHKGVANYLTYILKLPDKQREFILSTG